MTTTAGLLHEFNPFLSDESAASLRSAICTWLQLCVLEDRLERLMALAKAGKDLEATLVRVSDQIAKDS
jgi:hypothetical protein